MECARKIWPLSTDQPTWRELIAITYRVIFWTPIVLIIFYSRYSGIPSYLIPTPGRGALMRVYSTVQNMASETRWWGPYSSKHFLLHMFQNLGKRTDYHFVKFWYWRKNIFFYYQLLRILFSPSSHNLISPWWLMKDMPFLFNTENLIDWLWAVKREF